MKWIGRKQEAPQPATGRRRPVYDRPEEPDRPQAFSYYSQRPANPDASARQPLESFREETVRPNRLLSANRWTLIGSTIMLLVSLGAVTYLGSAPKIVPVTSDGSAYFMQDTEAYAQAATELFNASVLNHSKLAVDTSRVSAEMLRKYPEIQSATVTLPLIGTRPVVYIEPYKPSLILATSDSSAYLLDTNGRALISASQIGDTGELSVPTVQDKSSLSVVLGAQALPATTVQFISDVATILKAAGTEVNSMSLPATAGELDVTVSGQPYYVKFNLQGEAKQQAGTLLATRQRLAKDKIVPTQYVDVRVPERAYYK